MGRNFLERRMQGQVPATQSAKLHNESNKEEKIKKNTQSSADTRASIKIPKDLKKELNIIKSMEEFKFDYEAIQLLVDKYVSGLSVEDRKKYETLKKYL
ncbi:hypothetical protein ACWCL1_08270 [Ligilactobacillus sp. LYQ135]